jgi:Cu/Ag efflux pump CusA
VLPDLTKPTVIILTEAPGLAPEEVETRVTQPIESALMGVAGLTRLRSNSDVALSLVYAEFGWDTDIYKARMLVQERLQGVREQLPEGVQPFMTPVASLMGEILLVGVRSTIKEGEPGYLPPREVRSLADWTMKRRLQSIPGIAEILNMGGGVKRIEIQPDPFKMQAHGVSFDELEASRHRSREHHHGRLHQHRPHRDHGAQSRHDVELDDIARTVIKKVNDRPISIGDVAEVVWGIEPMRGDATVSRPGKIRRPTASSCPSPKLPALIPESSPSRSRPRWTNSSPPSRRASRPRCCSSKRTSSINAIGNLTEAIRDGAIMVTIMCCSCSC